MPSTQIWFESSLSMTLLFYTKKIHIFKLQEMDLFKENIILFDISESCYFIRRLLKLFSLSSREMILLGIIHSDVLHLYKRNV